MRDFQKVKLSSKYTDVSFFGFLIMAVMLPFILVYVLISVVSDPNGGTLFALLLILVATWFGIYSALHLAKAKIVDNKFYLRKFLRPEKVYPLSGLVGLKVYETGRDDYIIFTMQDDTGKQEKYMVYTTSRLLYGDEVIQSREVLEEILSENKKQ